MTTTSITARVLPLAALLAAIAPVVAFASGGCSQLLDITDGTLIAPEAGVTEGGTTCTADLAADPANCGACGNVCPADHAKPTCEVGVCKLTCEPGFGDCDSMPVNACEVELAVTPSHCGSCGHDCLGGACTAGVCQPRSFADTDAPIRNITVNATTLFSLSGWTVRSRALTSDASATVTSPPAWFAGAIAANTTALFSTKQLSATVEVHRFESAKPPTCVFADKGVVALATDDEGVYVATYTSPNGRLELVKPGSTCAAADTTTLGIGNKRARALVTDKEWIYWTSVEGNIAKGRKDGTAQVTVVQSAPGAAGIAHDETDVYWLSTRGLNRVSKLATCADEAVCAQLFAPDARGAFALEDKKVYVAVGDATRGFAISIRDKTTGAELGRVLAAEEVTAIATDVTSIYFAAGQRVNRVVK